MSKILLELEQDDLKQLQEGKSVVSPAEGSTPEIVIKMKTERVHSLLITHLATDPTKKRVSLEGITIRSDIDDSADLEEHQESEVFLTDSQLKRMLSELNTILLEGEINAAR
jgi:hypothetical protein